MKESSQREIRAPSGFNPLKISALEHQYADHPSLHPDALRSLARRLYESGTEKIKFIDPHVQAGSDFILETQAPHNRSIDDIFDNLESPGTWIAIYEARTDPEYGALIDEIIHSGSQMMGKSGDKIFDSDAYIFISSPPSLTPFHIDRENNLFLQIRGHKQFTVWDPKDRNTVSERGVESWIVRGSLADVPWSKDHLHRAAVHQDFGPGEGVFMPSTSAHMSKTHGSRRPNQVEGDEISISIGVVYYSTLTRKWANIYAFNSFLRRLGWKPQPPGESSQAVDSFKYWIGWLATRILSRAGRFRIQRGM